MSMQIPPQYRCAEQLETFLGDPLDPTSGLSFAEAVANDETERFPVEVCARLDAWGLPLHYIPVALGGRFRSFETMLSLTRCIARRDLTTAIGHAKTYLGAMCVWIAGNPAQQRGLAALIAAGHPVSLGLTEKSHGADLLASDLVAERCESGWRLDGEKWLINNATRGAALTLFARTSTAGGPRGFTLFLVEKDKLQPGSFEHLPKIKTHGIRGADISGIRFSSATVGDDAVIGEVGKGLDLTIKGLQLSRVMCTGLSLGAADTAIRGVLDFAVKRPIYNTHVIAIPHARRSQAQAFADLLICDSLALVTARALHLNTSEMSIHSAIAKFLVPKMSERICADTAMILGARHYLRQDHHSGIFQKLLRDNRLVGLFDGSAVVNLFSLALQQRVLGRRDNVRCDRNLFDLNVPLAEFDPSALALNSRLDGVLNGFEDARTELAALVDRPVVQLIQAFARDLSTALIDHTAAVAALPDGAAQRMEPAAFDLAERYCRLHAGAAAVQMWMVNRSRLPACLSSGLWLAVGLARLLTDLGLPRSVPDGLIDALVDDLLTLNAEGQSFSLVPLKLGAGPGAA